ncbi:MAG: hypothetical protein GY696_39560, partial [Gammaproteobacteria bacterium]|nr:hypothetical protein [Gammaproteobacteria bacterium]
MDKAWTWPWVVFFKEVPGLFRISAYSQATGWTIRTAHIGWLRQSSTGIQEGSAENGPGNGKGDLPEDPESEEPLPEEPLPEKPLPERPLPEEPLPEEPLPEKPLPEEEKAQKTP